MCAPVDGISAGAFASVAFRALLDRPWLMPETPSVMAQRPAVKVNIPVHHHFGASRT